MVGFQLFEIMSKFISIELKNNLSELGKLNEAIEEYCGLHNLSIDIVFAVTLSVEEIVTNVISHGYEDDGEHLIIVRINKLDNVIDVEVEDDGVAFNPLEEDAPDLTASLEDRSIGGLGIHLVRNYMDDIKYLRKDHKNLLSMKKNI